MGLMGIAAIGSGARDVIVRGKKVAAFVTGFFEVLTYVIAIGEVVNNLDNLWNVLGYCLGFCVGTVVGMLLDERTASGFANVRIISRYKAQNIVEEIRKAGYGATVGWGHGRGGTVGMIVAVTVLMTMRVVMIVLVFMGAALPDRCIVGMVLFVMIVLHA